MRKLIIILAIFALGHFSVSANPIDEATARQNGGNATTEASAWVNVIFPTSSFLIYINKV